MSDLQLSDTAASSWISMNNPIVADQDDFGHSKTRHIPYGGTHHMEIQITFFTQIFKV